MSRVAIVEDGRHLTHNSFGHPERPDRVEAIRTHLASVPSLAELPRLSLVPVDDESLLRVHSRAHLERVAALCARGGGSFDQDTYATATSDVCARLSAGGAVAAVDAVLDGDHDAAFAVIRPPGHHATASRAMGFCLYNNVAVAIEQARAEHGLRRVAIVDIDVHHGNGTEATYWNDPGVLYTSLHQFPFYPGTGALADRGGPEAAGLTVNIPLPAGTSASAWLAEFNTVTLPAVEAFEPELVVVSCGFDAHRDDPLAELRLETETYAEVAERLVALRGLSSSPGTVWVLEGGYDLEALAASTHAVLDVLMRA
ncbi:MAG: histone deacetylase [Candidatus Dormibacteraeota bacterium]|uniref:Histone deacetylase n=1 Tax=Candidatus Amunia macphersoniae TaxID=3127014 RepID=A0A934KIF2_9BACT|nr:histone deacetylase [Candidatus Dormibacteraeota bacterium]